MGTTEDWTEPHDVLAPTPEIAAQKVIASHGDSGEVDRDEEVQITVREITVDGEPLSGWRYYRGKTWPIWRASVHWVNAKGDSQTERPMLWIRK